MKIYCVIGVSDTQKVWLREQLPNEEIYFAQDLEEVEKPTLFEECEVALGNPPLEWVQNSSKLKWLQLSSAGLDPFLPVIEAGRIPVSNLKGFFSRPAAETAIGGILSVYRKLDVLQKAQMKHQWVYDQVRNACDTLFGKEILILGGGSIGQMVGAYLVPFGCTITFHTRRSMENFPTLDTLDSEMGKFDIIVGCLAEAPETINLLNADRLDKLKSTAVVVNVGRGSLIDEPHLLQMLSKGMLRGAFLDVTKQEPIPQDSALWDTPNLLLGQHTAGGTITETMDKLRFYVQNVKNYRNGKPENVVER